MSIFINNKYTTWYYNIISNAKSQYRKKKQGIYYESHHIFPKCLGGSNKKENLVLLTAREHFICHWLLTKMLNGQEKYRMYYAFSRLSITNDLQERNYSSKQYEIMKKFLSIAASEKGKKQTPWNKGKRDIYSLKTKEQMSLRKKKKYKITFTNGKIVIVFGLRDACKKYKIDRGGLFKLRTGQRKTCKNVLSVEQIFD